MNSADVDGTELVAEDDGNRVVDDTEEDGSGGSVTVGDTQTRFGLACNGVECSGGAASDDGGCATGTDGAGVGSGEGRDD